MDDVFDDTVDDNFLMQRESQRESEKFQNMGMKEGILEKKFNQDEDVVAEYFIQGFNKTIAAQRLLGRIALIEYIAHKILPQDKNETAQIIKTLNEVVEHVGKEDNEKIANEIDNLLKEVKKFQVEP